MGPGNLVWVEGKWKPRDEVFGALEEEARQKQQMYHGQHLAPGPLIRPNTGANLDQNSYFHQRQSQGKISMASANGEPIHEKHDSDPTSHAMLPLAKDSARSAWTPRTPRTATSWGQRTQVGASPFHDGGESRSTMMDGSLEREGVEGGIAGLSVWQNGSPRGFGESSLRMSTQQKESQSWSPRPTGMPKELHDTPGQGWRVRTSTQHDPKIGEASPAANIDSVSSNHFESEGDFHDFHTYQHLLC